MSGPRAKRQSVSRRHASPRQPAVRALLLRWYRRRRRDLPWRRTKDPYAVWVSEVMLQQTRVETVIPYYHRFLERFPGVRALARASLRDVLAAWSGLGYYRRARNLHAAAGAMMREHGGRVPETRAALEALPGIGAYTAAAIASIAFGTPAAAVDGNVIRVIARWDGLEGRRDEGRLRRRVAARAESLAPGPSPGDWTQALMELGATVCLPKEPLCERCPVSRACAGRRSGRPERFPYPARAGKPRREKRVVLIVRDRSRVLLLPDPRDDGATLAPPSAVVKEGASSGRVAQALARAHGADEAPRGPTKSFRHRTYSHDYSIEVWVARGTGGKRDQKSARWTSRKGLLGLPVRATTIKAIKGL